MGKRAVGAVVAGVVALCACATSPRAQRPADVPQTVPASSPTAHRTTTTTIRRKPAAAKTAPAPAFSFDDSVPPPKLVNTGTDYVAILKSFRLYGNWIAGNRPDPALVSNYLVAGKTRDAFVRDLTRLRASGMREIEDLGDPSHYTILSATPDAFSAKAVEDVRAHRLVNARGVTTGEIRYTSPTTYLMLAVMVRGKWYLASVASQEPVNVHL